MGEVMGGLTDGAQEVSVCGNGTLLFLNRMCRFHNSAGRGNAIS